MALIYINEQIHREWKRYIHIYIYVQKYKGIRVEEFWKWHFACLNSKNHRFWTSLGSTEIPMSSWYGWSRSHSAEILGSSVYRPVGEPTLHGLLQPHCESQSHLLTSADPQAIPRSLAVLEILLLPGPRMSHRRRQRLPSSVLHGMPFNLTFYSCPMRQTGQKFPVSVFHRHITSVCVCVYTHTRAWPGAFPVTWAPDL